MAPQVGEKFPDGVKFEWAPITDPNPMVCGKPEEYNASEEFKGKKVVLVSVPGAFTPGCQARHLEPYIENIHKIADKGVDDVVVIASNDPFVMSAWGRVNGATSDSKIKFMSDTKTKFSEQIGWLAGVGDRTARYAMIIDDGTIKYAEVENSPREVSVSGADAILSRL